MRSHQFRFQGHLAFCLLLRGKVRTNVTGAGASSSLHAFPSGKNKSKAKGKKKKPAGRAKQKRQADATKHISNCGAEKHVVPENCWLERPETSRVVERARTPAG
jgi:hypothetical protein